MKVRQLRGMQRLHVAALKGDAERARRAHAREREARLMADGLSRHLGERVAKVEEQLKRARLVLGQYSVVLDPQLVHVEHPLEPFLLDSDPMPNITFSDTVRMNPVEVQARLDQLHQRRHVLVGVGKHAVGYALSEGMVLSRIEWPSVAQNIAKAIAQQLGERGLLR